MLYFASTKIIIDKVTSNKEMETNQRDSRAGERVTRRQDVNSGATIDSTNNFLPSTPKIAEPKIDATDRRGIEAQNEEKSHTTKEELDDIKRTHYKEKKKKKKKEQNDMERYQTVDNPAVQAVSYTHLTLPTKRIV